MKLPTDSVYNEKRWWSRTESEEILVVKKRVKKEKHAKDIGNRM